MIQLLDSTLGGIASAFGGSRLGFRQANAETDAQRDGEDDEEDDTRANPLPLARFERMLDSGIDLLVAALEIVYNIVGMLFCSLDRRCLLYYHGVEVLDQVYQFVDGPLNLEELVVPRTHITQDCVGLTGAVGSELHKNQGQHRVLGQTQSAKCNLPLTERHPRCPNPFRPPA